MLVYALATSITRLVFFVIHLNAISGNAFALGLAWGSKLFRLAFFTSLLIIHLEFNTPGQFFQSAYNTPKMSMIQFFQSAYNTPKMSVISYNLFALYLFRDKLYIFQT